MSLEETKAKIEQEIKDNKIILFMKGNKMAPQCGFSAQVVHILNSLGVEYETRDVLHTRLSRGWQGRRPALVAVVGLVVIAVCYIGVNLLGIGLHSYGWFFG